MAVISDQGALAARPGRRRSWSSLGLIPFFLFAILFIGLPVTYLVLGSFEGLDGKPTLQNYAELSSPSITGTPGSSSSSSSPGRFVIRRLRAAARSFPGAA